MERIYVDEGEDVQVLNVATIGYCTRSEVELLRVKGLPFQPDRVVLVFVENDFDNFNREAFNHLITALIDSPARSLAVGFRVDAS